MNTRSIYYVGGLDSNQLGAVGTHTSGIISGFKQNGFHVTGIFLEGKTPKERCDKEIIAPSPKVNFSALSKILSILSICRQTKKIEHEVLVYHRYDPFLSPLVVNRNTILEYNDDVVAQVRIALKNRQWSPLGRVFRRVFYPVIFRISERYCFSRALSVVVVTEQLRKFVESVEPKSRPVFVPNGSNAQFNPSLVETPAEDDATIRLAHVGTLTHWDGLIELLEGVALYEKRKKNCQVSLRIVGDGVLRSAIAETIGRLNLEKIVSLEDPVPHDQAIKILHQADVVPLLKTVSSYGLSPMKFYEALSLGCFLICSNIEHINEMRDDEGYVVPFPFSSEHVADALEYVGALRNQIREDRAFRAKRAKFEHSWKNRVCDLLAKSGSHRK